MYFVKPTIKQSQNTGSKLNLIDLPLPFCTLKAQLFEASAVSTDFCLLQYEKGGSTGSLPIHYNSAMTIRSAFLIAHAKKVPLRSVKRFTVSV